MNLIPRSSNLFLDDVFNNFFDSNSINNFKCDIYEKDDKYYIEMDVPGYTKEDTIIECDRGYLTIKISKKEDNEEESRNYIRRERNMTSFSRSFYVGDVETENIKATFKNGCLIIEVPKEEKQDTKKTILIEEN